jgi:hypothetical protein
VAAPDWGRPAAGSRLHPRHPEPLTAEGPCFEALVQVAQDLPLNPQPLPLNPKPSKHNPKPQSTRLEALVQVVQDALRPPQLHQHALHLGKKA